VAVTGGCGFIGGHLVDALIEAGVASVIVLDSLKYAAPPVAQPRVAVHQHNLGRDSVADLAHHLEGVDFLFHLAAEKHNQSLSSPEDVVLSNILGTQGLYAAAARAGVKKVVFSSSLYAHGRLRGESMLETDVPAPKTLYGISKLTGEHLGAYLTATTGIPAVALRYYFAYGPRQYPGLGYKSVIVANFERLLRGEAPLIHGDGYQSLDYVYVGDVAAATMMAMEKAPAGELYNVGSGVATNIVELTKAMIAVSGSSLAPIYDAADWTAGSRRVGDNDKICGLGWSPKTSLHDGLSRTWTWLKNRTSLT